MAVDINFINLDDNDAVLGPEIDLGIKNSVLLDLQFDITEPEDHVGFIYRNDAKIGEFGKTGTRGKYLEWYAGSGVPIYVKDGDIIKAELINSEFIVRHPGEWYFHEDEWYYCVVDDVELKDICSAFLDDTNPNQIRTVTRSGQSHDIPLNNIDTRYVTSMRQMFYGASNFNQNISNWDVSNVTTMTAMFSWTSDFNLDISNWDVSNVTSMNQMFYNATNFNQDLSKWCVTNITSKPFNFDTNSGLTTANLPRWGTCPNG